MPLTPGARVGHYEILSLVGAGGMGAVYKAIDRRLDRSVAIKVLNEVTPDLSQRFEREARAIAALQHPRICTLIDVGVHDGTEYLVMEYLDGGTLTCPQPLEKVIEYGIQIADALDAAHRKGITHRDLKPDNIIVTRGGIKLLDFGIAKAAGLGTVTQTGVAVGTPAYMAPEQWRGEPADHRTDIYALGCVLYEMATGLKTRDTPLSDPRLDWIVRGCLAAEPDDRWQSARDVKRLLESTPVRGAEPSRPRWSWLWTTAVALIGLGGIAAAWLLKPAAPAPLYQLSIDPPQNGTFLFAGNREGGLAMAPDGSAVAFTSITDGKVRLWIRRFDTAESQMVPGIEGAFYPFWSPDSRWVAFFTPNRLMRIAVAGGPPQAICATDPRSLGGSWGANDVILVTTDVSNIQQVRAGGGALTPVTTGRWPHFLPDGRRFLFETGGGIWVGAIGSADAPRRIVDANAWKPAYSSGHLLFIRDRNLFAQPFDPATLQLSGEAFPVAEILAGNMNDNPAEYSVTARGVLAYAVGQRPRLLVWRDRGGKVREQLTSGTDLGTPRVSPDGTRIAFSRRDEGNLDIWISTTRGSEMKRLTFDPAYDRWPIWSPDGATITYSSGVPGAFELFRRAADGSGTAERLPIAPASQHPMDWSSDGRYLAFTQNLPGFGTDLMMLPAAGKPYVFLHTVVSEAHSQFDPKSGKWIAYSSDDSGRREIYVKPFIPGQPASEARWQISTAGGTMPRWRRDGKELYYWALDGRMMAVQVADQGGPAFKWSTPVELFEAGPPTLRTNDISFDVTPDGQQFLFAEAALQAGSQSLMIVTDWLRASGQTSNSK